MLWLIGGTSESGLIARALDAHQIPYCVTVTTENARSLYGSQAQVRVGALASEAMPQFIQAQGIQRIVDASHPFATIVSQGAMAAAQSCRIPYLRFERAGEGADKKRRIEQAESDKELVVQLPSLQRVLQSQWLEGERSLLVLGYRMLEHFAVWQSRTVLYSRILPSQVALERAIAAGFTPDRLIALRPPVSRDLEAALWQQWGITQVIAKASGKAGGEDVKRKVVQELGIRLILIERPVVVYQQQTGRLEEVLKFSLS